MNQFTVYSIEHHGSSVFTRRITANTFSSFEKGRLYAIKLAEKLASLHNETVEMTATGLKFGNKEYLICKVLPFDVH